MAVRFAVLMSCSAVYVTDVAVIRAAVCEGLSLQPRPASRLQKVIVEILADSNGWGTMTHESTEMIYFSCIDTANIS